MAVKFFIILLLGTFYQGLPYGLAELTFTPQELIGAVGDSYEFTIQLDDALEQNASVHLEIDNPDITRVDPLQFEIPAHFSFKQDIIVTALDAGHTLITANVSSSAVINTANAYIRVSSYHSHELYISSDVVGWVYFVAWSISFYPQLIENWKRKSVVGLNFDFLALNLLGFFLYSLFNCGLYWIPLVRDQYHHSHERSAIPVKPNDIFFSVHAFFITLVTITQCFFYERGGQRVSIIGRTLIGVYSLFLFITLLCVIFNALLWLDFLYYSSYVKLTITLIKYVPQAFMNYRRQSTEGWSIGNVLLDFTGGVLSMLQMIFDAYNFNDWFSIFSDPTKFGLGLFSVVFDLLFIVQHYILYRNRPPYQHLSGYETIDGVDSTEVETGVENGSESTPPMDVT